MDEQDGDLNRALMLDGNAAGGMLYDVFTADMTGAPTECASCGRGGGRGTGVARHPRRGKLRRRSAKGRRL